MEVKALAPRSDVTVATSAPRLTPVSGGAAFKEVLGRSIVRSAEVAMRTLPGGPLMAVALRGSGGPLPASPLPFGGGGMAVRGGAGVAEGPGGARSSAQAVGPLGGGGAGVAGGAGAGEPSIESSIAQSQEMNLYYLQIQEAVNAQNRSFTALSNVLKAEHDTVKTAIGNIR